MESTTQPHQESAPKKRKVDKVVVSLPKRAPPHGYWPGLQGLPTTKRDLLSFDPSLEDTQHLFADWVSAYWRYKRQMDKKTNTGEFRKLKLDSGFFKRLHRVSGLGVLLVGNKAYVWEPASDAEKEKVQQKGADVWVNDQGFICGVASTR